MTTLPLQVRHFPGLQDYATTLAAMQQFTEQRDAQTPDELWLLEHPPVLTQGQAGRAQHVLQLPSDLPLVQTDRGGQVTWHGPGQIVCYALFDLQRLHWHVRDLVSNAEASIVAVLADYGVAAEARSDAPGIYLLDGRKIASLGFKIRRGCSYHGMALNVSNTFEGFNCIEPCGQPGLRMARLNDLIAPAPALSTVAEAWGKHWQALHQVKPDAA